MLEIASRAQHSSLTTTIAFFKGAMENKGLNVFNTAYVLADPKTATDADYERVEGVIGHEYFHNWTGNRVTCQDWFQLTLKEVCLSLQSVYVLVCPATHNSSLCALAVGAHCLSVRADDLLIGQLLRGRFSILFVCFPWLFPQVIKSFQATWDLMLLSASRTFGR